MADRLTVVSADATLLVYFTPPEGVWIDVQRQGPGHDESHALKVSVTADTTDEVQKKVEAVRLAIIEALS